MTTQTALQTRLDGDTSIGFRLPSLTGNDLSTVPVAFVPIESIVVSQNGHGDTHDLDGLVLSIKTRGMLEPLIVTPDGRLLAGRRRLDAARRAGLSMVPIRVCEIASERAAIEISLIENVERTDLDPLTRAQSYRALIDQGASVEEIARLVGQEIEHVHQHLALLDLHPDVQAALHARTLSLADARAFTPLQIEDQATVLQEIRQSPKPLSSRQVKARVDVHRVLRLVRNADAEENSNETLDRNYDALFDAEGAATKETPQTPLDELNSIITEMVAAAQGDDQLRGWARRLSHILESLQSTASQKNVSEVIQELLL